MIKLKLKKKKNTLIELIVFILLLPVVIALISSLFINIHNTSKIVISNISNFSNLEQIISQINKDVKTTYNVKTEENKITLYTSNEEIQYYFKKDTGELYRNEKYVMHLNDLELKEITNSDCIYPLYQITFHIDINNMKNSSSPFEITTKISLPIKVGDFN